MVRFDENNEIIERKSAFSKKMRDITNQNIVLQYNTNRPLADSKTIKLKGENEIVFTQSITNISSWARSILPSSKNDFIVVEQKLKLGSFGSIVFIFPANFMSLIGFA
jgi:hypothetical protein